jgi:hypothetical protein
VQRQKAAALVLSLVGFIGLGAKCTSGGGPKPTVTVTLHAVSDDLNDLLVVPSDAALYVNASFVPVGPAIAPETFEVTDFAWAGGAGVPATIVLADPDTGLAVFPPFTLASGTHRILAMVWDANGAVGSAFLDFAVRDRPTTAPIGTGQQIWLDFSSDRDGVPGADFPLDLETFGLGSPVDPLLSAEVEAEVASLLLARVSEAYDQDPNGLGSSDAAEVVFLSDDPGSGDVTRICVGGPDPSGGNVVGKIAMDPSNSNRNSVECGTIPPTGIFPRELTAYQSQAAFRQSFDPLMPARGGTAVGEHALDAIVLDPGFDPGSATPEELARYTDITTAMQRFADALGSIVAHETGHALGLVPPGRPGVGLFGGQLGPEFIHDVESDLVTTPAANYLMNQGGSFNFAKLAGLSGHPLPFFRALDYAYLRDRVMLDSKVTQLLAPPAITDVSPSAISGTVQLQVTGTNFANPVKIRLVDPPASHEALGEAFVSDTLVTGLVFSISIPPGSYLVQVENPDGQTALSPATVTVQ